MSQVRTAIVLMTAMLVVGGRAAAQDGAVDPGRRAQWDVDGTWEFLGVDLPESGFERLSQWDSSSISGLRVGLGRYWTTHLKTEGGITVVPPLRRLDYETYPESGVAGAYLFTERRQVLTTVSANLTYQFFENSFTHPYVSAGIRLDSVHDHRFRKAGGNTIRGGSYIEPALDERSSSLSARPIVAVGAKCYFNERVFVRAELPLAFGRSGVYSGGFHFGLGVDF
jgi:hypothetical protein